MARLLCALMCLLACGPAQAQWLSYPASGIPRLPDGKPDLSASAPRVDGKPDLSGTWVAECPYMISSCWDDSRFFDLARGLAPDAVQPTPWAAAIQAQRERREHVDDPLGYCLPPGVPRVTFYRPFRIVQAQGVTVFLHETDIAPIFRQVYTDGRTLPIDPQPSWLGYSIGRWEGETFVVESLGFRDGGWLDTRKGRTHSDAMRLTERFRRLDLGHLELSLTIDDPKAYQKPWTVTTRLTLQPDLQLLESFCDSHAKTMEHRRIGNPPAEPPSGPTGR